MIDNVSNITNEQKKQVSNCQQQDLKFIFDVYLKYSTQHCGSSLRAMWPVVGAATMTSPWTGSKLWRGSIWMSLVCWSKRHQSACSLHPRATAPKDKLRKRQRKAGPRSLSRSKCKSHTCATRETPVTRHLCSQRSWTWRINCSSRSCQHSCTRRPSFGQTWRLIRVLAVTIAMSSTQLQK